MNFNFTALKRQEHEELWQYDGRVSAMLPVVAGYVYSDSINYDGNAGDFNIYIRWDDELNSHMNDRLPETGFFVRATWEQSRELLDIGDPLPVYIKLISVDGRIYPYRKYILVNGRPFSVEYNGSNAFLPDTSVRQEQGLPISETAVTEATGSQRDIIAGSKRGLPGGSRRSIMAGSQRGITAGSQKGIIVGSGRGILTGSRRGISQNNNNNNNGAGTGSQRGITAGSQRSIAAGSGRGIIAGSRRGVLNGSRRAVTTESFGKDISPSDEYTVIYEGNTFRVVNTADQTMDGHNRIIEEFPLEWQLINRNRRPEGKRGGNAALGYGLDLI